jgi:hypothetical protein
MNEEQMAKLNEIEDSIRILEFQVRLLNERLDRQNQQNKPMRKVTFNGTECNVVFDKYATGGKAIRLTEDGSPYATATINDPEAYLKKDQVLVKDYSENKGMVKALQEAGIIQPIYPYPLGTFGANAWICQVLEEEDEDEFERAY